jgi:carbamoyltransferase
VIILGIHLGNHDSSIALLKNEKILFHLQGERLSNIKYDENTMQALLEIKKYVEYVDHIAITGLDGYEKFCDQYVYQVKHLSNTFLNHDTKVHKFFNNHHEIHAATAFYNSGFDNALCVVIDGVGSRYDVEIGSDKFFGHETYSSFIASYPNNFDLVERQITTIAGPSSGKTWVDDKTYITQSFSEANAFEHVALKLKFTPQDAGKVMGLSSYGKENNIKLYKDNLLNDDFFVRKNEFYTEFVYDLKENFEDMANLAFSLQIQSQNNIVKKINELIEKTKNKNICLSGGFFLNCVSNYNLLKNIDEDVNVYVEPMSNDSGNSVGVAKFLYHSLTQSKNKNPQSSIYYGPKHSYSLEDLKNQKTKKVFPKDVAKIISEKNIVALYQGSSESGPRALGNRSILYDPRDINGKDHVNIVKKREWFRPFAGTVLIEHAQEWFDLKNLKDSKFMMFAVDVIKNKQELIPAITHVDGTCRIQTIEKEDNLNYYVLIEEFYKITGVPILFNTSLNLAGDVINETLKDALDTFNNSEINYLYLPELEILVFK